MHTTTKAAAAAGAVVLALTGCGSGGDGGGRTLRLALNQTEEHPSFTALQNFGERLGESTDGRWDIEVYPNESLGAQQEVLQLVSDGTVDMAITASPVLEAMNPDFTVFGLPMVFDSVEHQLAVMNDPEIVGDLYTSLEGEGVTVLGGITAGSRNIYTAEGPITEPADLEGMKLRVMESDAHVEMAELMGASATPMGFGEVYTALQSGVLDGAENNEVSYITQKHNEVAPHFARTEHAIVPDYLTVYSGLLEEMSEEDRAALDEEWAATVEEHTELWFEATDQAIADMEAAGVEINDVDDEAFREAVEPLIDDYLTDATRPMYEQTREAAE